MTSNYTKLSDRRMTINTRLWDIDKNHILNPNCFIYNGETNMQYKDEHIHLMSWNPITKKGIASYTNEDGVILTNEKGDLVKKKVHFPNAYTVFKFNHEDKKYKEGLTRMVENMQRHSSKKDIKLIFTR